MATDRLMTGMFRDRDSAERGYACLKSRGYTDKDVSLLMSNDTRNRYFPQDSETKTELGTKATEGAGIGAVAGGGLGALLLGLAAAGIAGAGPAHHRDGPARRRGGRRCHRGSGRRGRRGAGRPRHPGGAGRNGTSGASTRAGWSSESTRSNDEDADFIERGWTDARGEQIDPVGRSRGREADMNRVKGLLAATAISATLLISGLASAQTPADQVGWHRSRGR